MMIENGTSDDTMIKVTGGPGGDAKSPPKEVQFWLKPGGVWPGKNPKPGSIPALPWTVHFYAKVNLTKVQPNTKGNRLTLTKAANNGFKVTPT